MQYLNAILPAGWYTTSYSDGTTRVFARKTHGFQVGQYEAKAIFNADSGLVFITDDASGMQNSHVYQSMQDDVTNGFANAHLDLVRPETQPPSMNSAEATQSINSYLNTHAIAGSSTLQEARSNGDMREHILGARPDKGGHRETEISTSTMQKGTCLESPRVDALMDDTMYSYRSDPFVVKPSTSRPVFIKRMDDKFDVVLKERTEENDKEDEKNAVHVEGAPISQAINDDTLKTKIPLGKYGSEWDREHSIPLASESATMTSESSERRSDIDRQMLNSAERGWRRLISRGHLGMINQTQKERLWGQYDALRERCRLGNILLAEPKNQIGA